MTDLLALIYESTRSDSAESACGCCSQFGRAPSTRPATTAAFLQASEFLCRPSPILFISVPQRGHTAVSADFRVVALPLRAAAISRAVCITSCEGMGCGREERGFAGAYVHIPQIVMTLQSSKRDVRLCQPLQLPNCRSISEIYF